MKIVFITYSEAVDAEVMEILQALGVQGYTKWAKVLGKGQSSGPHMLSHVWPQGNDVVMSCVHDDIAEKILGSIRELRKTIGHEGVKAFSLPLADMT